MKNRASRFLKSLANRTLWEYSPHTPHDALFTHARRAALVVRAYAVASLLMMTLMLEFLLSQPGAWRTFWMLILIPAICVSLTLMLPALVGFHWIGEVDRECRRRGLDRPADAELHQKLPMFALKTAAYFLLFLAFGQLHAHQPAWLPAVSLLAGLLAAVSLGSAIRARVSTREWRRLP